MHDLFGLCRKQMIKMEGSETMLAMKRTVPMHMTKNQVKLNKYKEKWRDRKVQFSVNLVRVRSNLSRKKKSERNLRFSIPTLSKKLRFWKTM